jgi:MoaA/NifB/PqqE/SkfB family radical SAM enzyme
MTYTIHDWIKAVTGEASDKLLFKKLKKIRPPLTSVTFSRNCNLACKHCIYPRANRNDLNFFNLTRIDMAIDATRKAGVQDLLHVGRTLRAEHLPILVKYSNLGMSVGLIDNGGGAALIPHIKEMGLFFSGGVDISIDGGRKAHERQRGKGTFDKAIAGARAFAEVAEHISVTATASAINFETIASSMYEIAQYLPARVFQITTTSPARHHERPMNLSAEMMRVLFADALKTSETMPITLGIYLNDDIAAIIDMLAPFGPPVPKFISLEWTIGNLTVAYFPMSIVPSEEIAIDANGRHILPFSLDWHLDERPEEWEMNDDLILTDPDRSYENLIDKFKQLMGEKALAQEKRIFKDFF